MHTSHHYLHQFEQAITTLKEQGLYRHFIPIKRRVSAFPEADITQQTSIDWHLDSSSLTRSDPLIVFCSNDYLGLGQHPVIIESMKQALEVYGAGSGGTRNISGTTQLHDSLERSLATHYQQESALLFTSGYVSNQTALPALSSALREVVFFSDSGNHASIIEGIRISKQPKHIFEHNNLAHLESLLQQYPLSTNKIIVFESVYSMNGAIANIPAIAKLAQQYNALTYVDEVHAVGLYGKTGLGYTQHAQCLASIDIIQGTFAKAVGIMGGFVVGKSPLVDCIRSFGSGFIFSTSLPPVILAGIQASLNIIVSQEGQQLRAQLFQRVAYLREQLTSAGIPYLPNNSHITPLLIQGTQQVKYCSEQLLKQHHIYVQPIFYPTVPKGQERFRITLQPYHTKEMIHQLVSALQQLLT